MTIAKIYKPTKTSMQSGRAKSKYWILEFVRKTPAIPEPLMGWQSSGDTQKQVKIKFSSKEAAIFYAKKQGIVYDVINPQPRSLNIKSYADNFSSDRKISWTH